MTAPATGIAAVALLIIVLGYWVPYQVRYRQRLLEAHIQDRDSAHVRVVNVHQVGSAAPSAAGALTGGSSHVGILHAHVDAADADAPQLGRGGQAAGLAVDRGRQEARAVTVAKAGGQAKALAKGQKVDQVSAAGQAKTAGQVKSVSQTRTVGQARARRRLITTLILLVVCGASWLAFVADMVPVAVPLASSAVTLLALVMGRRAALAAQRARAASASASTARAARPGQAKPEQNSPSQSKPSQAATTPPRSAQARSSQPSSARPSPVSARATSSRQFAAYGSDATARTPSTPAREGARPFRDSAGGASAREGARPLASSGGRLSQARQSPAPPRQSTGQPRQSPAQVSHETRQASALAVGRPAGTKPSVDSLELPLSDILARRRAG